MADWYRNDEERRSRGYGEPETGRYDGSSWSRERGYGDEEPARYGRSGRDRGYGDGYEQERYGRSWNRDRGMVERGADEVRSWFGDEEAEQRRRLDHPDRETYGMRGGSDYQSDSEYGRYGTGRAQQGQGQRSNWRDPDNDNRGYGDARSSGGQSADRSSGRFSPVTWTYTEIWAVPGAYSGQGPRGYQRSDDRIKEDVCERLAQHGRIDASNIEVTVDQGEVTLRGTIPDRQMKRKAEDIVENVSGVKDVKNELRQRQQHQNMQGQQLGQQQGQERTGQKERSRATT
jgi:osmotically-inducible protein OsmY